MFTIGYTQCNVFTEQTLRDNYERAESTRESARNELHKYMFFFQRYDNHMKSVKFANKQLIATQQRAELLQTVAGAGLQYVAFLLDAVNTVICTKRVLAWCYVYLYYYGNTTSNDSKNTSTTKQHTPSIYHPDKPSSSSTTSTQHIPTSNADILIQENLVQLEELIERLNSYTDRKLDELGSNEIRIDIISLTNTVIKYRNNICEHIASRLEQRLST